MGITSRSYDPLEPHAGEFRIRLKYTFDDGRVFKYGPFHVVNEAEAEVRLLAQEPIMLADVQAQDAATVADADGTITGTTGQATEEQVAWDYLKKAMRTEDPYHAYRKLKKAQDHFTAKGWSAAQIKANLGITNAQWSVIVTRWQYLNGDTATLQAYESIRASDPGTGEL